MKRDPEPTLDAQSNQVFDLDPTKNDEKDEPHSLLQVFWERRRKKKFECKKNQGDCSLNFIIDVLMCKKGPHALGFICDFYMKKGPHPLGFIVISI